MKKLLLAILSLGCILSVSAKKLEQPVETKYNRSSIYSILVCHKEQKFASEIESQFLDIPTPDKYDDHDLSVKVVSVDKKGKYGEDIDAFIEKNNIASRMVARWFDRDILTGQCDMELIKARGVYNASELDKELAARSARGIAMLQDAGEQLIGNTFLIVNEINYVDKAKKGQAFGIGLRILGALATAVTNDNSYMALGEVAGSMAETYKGFKVKITTRLYQLVWDEETAADFYTNFWTSTPDKARAAAFDANRGKFKLKYVGDVESNGNATSFLGINEDAPEMMVRKACQRAIDENVADLQKKYDQFRIKAPITEVDGGIKVQVGMKEGITPDSEFEVLEPQDENGVITYKRVAVIKPVDKKIWDNRYMAVEEGAYGADFEATTFKKVSGGDIYPGLLVRQIN